MSLSLGSDGPPACYADIELADAFLFVGSSLAVVVLVLALVETAFGLLMRLPQRLEAERETDSVVLEAYLEFRWQMR